MSKFESLDLLYLSYIRKNVLNFVLYTSLSNLNKYFITTFIYDDVFIVNGSWILHGTWWCFLSRKSQNPFRIGFYKTQYVGIQ